MSPTDLLTGLPGEDLIREGLLDFAAGRQTIPACLVSIAQPRLRSAGLLPRLAGFSLQSSALRPPTSDTELQLYRLLRHAGGDAYSSYNALVRQLISFEQALDHRWSRQRSERDDSKTAPSESSGPRSIFSDSRYSRRNRTVAEHLGETPHLSPLLRKIRCLGLKTPDQLLHLAVKRGCTHYTPPDFDSSAIEDPGRDRLSDAELAIALISAAQEYHPQWVRCAAQLLGSPSLRPEDAGRLAQMERCESLLAHIAGAAAQIDLPEHRAHWNQMLDGIHPRQRVEAGRLPHPSRFTLQTGVTGPQRSTGPRSVWLRPAVLSDDER